MYVPNMLLFSFAQELHKSINESAKPANLASSTPDNCRMVVIIIFSMSFHGRELIIVYNITNERDQWVQSCKLELSMDQVNNVHCDVLFIKKRESERTCFEICGYFLSQYDTITING